MCAPDSCRKTCERQHRLSHQIVDGRFRRARLDLRGTLVFVQDARFIAPALVCIGKRGLPRYLGVTVPVTGQRGFGDRPSAAKLGCAALDGGEQVFFKVANPDI
jgi:hypothetical protein